MGKAKEYTKGKLTVVWKHEKCIHSTKCWKGLPTVFKPKERPWVNMEGAEAKQIAEQVSKCPSGALSYIMDHNTEQEEHVTETVVKIMENGPLVVQNDVKIVQADGSEISKKKPVALCRCGSSQNKPFCDGSHVNSGFKG